MPNENLKPEKAYNIDLGYIQKIGEHAALDVVVFYTYLNDAMVRRDFTFNGVSQIMYDGELSQVQAIVNAGSANIFGTSISIDVDINPQIRFHSNHTYTWGEDNEDNALRHVSPLFGNAGFVYEKDKLLVDFHLNYNGEISYANLAPSERDKDYIYAIDDLGNPYSPAWFTLNLKSSYKVNDNLQFYAGIDNILDKRYRPYSSGISASGRNIYISARLKF